MSSFHHILVADDELYLRLLIKLLIKQSHPTADVSAAGNGQEALQLYEQGGPDLIISEGDMSLLDGPELVRTLRARGATIPIILMSSDPQAEEKARESGATLFLRKTDLFIRLPEMLSTYLTPTPAISQ